MNHSIPENLQVETKFCLFYQQWQNPQKSFYFRRFFVHSDKVGLQKGQKIPIVKAIIVQYNIIAIKNQVVKCFLGIFLERCIFRQKSPAHPSRTLLIFYLPIPSFKTLSRLANRCVLSATSGRRGLINATATSFTFVPVGPVTIRHPIDERAL